MKNLLTLILTFLSFLTLGVSQNYSISKIDKDVKENADLIVRKSMEVHDISDPSLIKSSYTKVYTINNSKAKYIGNVDIYFQEGISKIKDLKIRVYDAAGNEIKKVKNKEIYESKAYSGNNNLADDGRVLSYTNTYAKYPYTIEYSYTEESKYAVTIPSFKPYPFNDYVKTFVEQSSFKILGDKKDIKSKVKNLDAFKNHFDLSEFPTKVSAENLPIYQVGKYSPPVSEIFPSFQFARTEGKFHRTDVEFDDWKSYGKWMYDAYLEDKYELTSTAKSKVEELTQGADSDYEKAKNIYDFVVNNTRYISIQLGEGGLEPFYAKDVHEKKYGDCKALAMYSLALMKEAEINAFYVVIEAGTDSQDNFEVDFASIQQGNHAIIGVEIDSDTIYADCTTSNSPFGLISSFTDGRTAVGINEKGGKLIKTNKYGDSENGCEIKTNLALNAKTKELSIDYQSKSKGCDISNKIAYYKESEETIKKKVLPYFYPQFAKETFKDVSFELDEDIYREGFQIKTKKFVSSAGNYLILPLQIHALDLTKVDEENRNTPLYFKDGFVNKYTTVIQIPQNYEWAGGIEPQEINSSFGSFNLQSIDVTNNELTLQIELKTKSGYFENNKLAEFNEWITNIKQLEKEKIIFRPLK